MGLFEWGEKRFARGIARAMVHSYKLLKADQPNLSEFELVKLTLSTRPGRPTQEILRDMDNLNFWENVANKSFTKVVYLLIRIEYIEYMGEAFEVESKKTNDVFKEVLDEEIQKAGL